ncbi:MAG TPA: GNAT family N-acetyltransferase [Bacteroidota bacterium]|nr:GNAT family N-acetyltransferase [Bacteroidota bacterium]
MAISIRLATESDNQGLIALARKSPMKGLLTLYIDRAPDFFSLNRLQGDPWRVYVAQDAEQVVGSISIAYRDVFAWGTTTRIAYLSDMKILPSYRSSTVAFRLIKAVYEYEHTMGADYFICSVIKGNESVMKLFHGRAGLPRMYAVGEVVIHNIIPVFRKQMNGQDSVREAKTEDAAQMKSLFEKFSQHYNFTPKLEENYFRRIIQHEEPFQNSNHFVSERAGTMVAMASTWDQMSMKNLVVEKHSIASRSLVYFSKLAAFTGIMPRLPDAGKVIRTLQMRHLAIDEGGESGLREILKCVYNICLERRYHVLQIVVAEGDPIASVLPRSLTTRVPLIIFCGSISRQSTMEALSERKCYEDICLV